MHAGLVMLMKVPQFSTEGADKDSLRKILFLSFCILVRKWTKFNRSVITAATTTTATTT